MSNDLDHVNRTMRTDEVRGAIQVDKYAGADFEIDSGFCVSQLMFDTLLVEYADGSSDEKVIGGIVVPMIKKYGVLVRLLKLVNNVVS
jgi:hypothetical protein